MPTVTVRLPGLLADLAAREVTVEAETVEEALEELLAAHPALEPHLLDGRTLRTHVALLVDGQVVDYPGAADRELEAGQELAVVQAVSGGRGG